MAIEQVIEGTGAVRMVNENFDAASSALTGGRWAAGITGSLKFAVYGGRVEGVDGANTEVTLTASNTNYVVRKKSDGVVSVSTATTNWNNSTDYYRLYSVVAGASTVTSYTDERLSSEGLFGGGGGGAVDSVNGATGVVVLDAGDIDAPDPGSYFTGTTVQAQLQELGAGGGAGVPNKIVNIALSDLTSVLTTGTLKGFWIAPQNGEFVDVWLGLGVVQSTSGIVRIDMNLGGSTIFTTRPYIEASEATSLTGVAAVFTSTPYAFNKGDIFTFDIDDAGTSSKGLQAVIEYAPT